MVNLQENAVLPVERVLGLRWNVENDQFVFELKFPKINEEILKCCRPPTKREMASLVMSIYDPLGLVVQFTIKGRILFQDAWLLKTGWDEAISEELFMRWKWWVTELAFIVNVRVPRCYSFDLGKTSKNQLHVFVDASSKAFAGVAYLRVEVENNIDVSLILARARVAPLKTLSIPRLELQAAVLGSRMSQTIREELQMRINSTYFWSDSQTVLAWIRSDLPNSKQFVGHRIGEILEITEVSQWRWIPTEDNVADDATRSNPDIDFDPTSRWYAGPSFLKLNPECWPKEKVTIQRNIADNSMDVSKKENVMVATTKDTFSVPDVSRFSSYMRLIRSTAWLIRFVYKYMGKSETGELKPNEIERAKLLWCKVVQQTCFPFELLALKGRTEIPSKSRILHLSPYLDNTYVIRMKGRCDLADNMDIGTRNPIILDPNHRFTELMLLHLHMNCSHQGVETVMNEMRMQYWVLNGRSAVKKAFRNCQWCKVRKVRPCSPEMASLPPERVMIKKGPFSITGVDYFGPMMVTVQRKQVKKYGVLFTCMSIRAIHLEIAPDLSTAAAINAIRRFIARRGVPEMMWSDNGTNFRGADRELREAIQTLDYEEITRTFSAKGMTWRFNSPSSPHMGGAWERLVKTVKIALSATLKEVAPREDVLSTLFTEAEFIINNRPLTYVSVDPMDPECLTPNHFLLGRKAEGNIPGRFDARTTNLRCQWKQVQELTERLWARWVKEYLPSLNRRAKWFKKSTPIKIGDIVVIADKDGPRNSWPLGRIVNVYPGRDGQVRIVDVRTKDGVYKRPAVKICVLDVHQSDEETISSSGERNVDAKKNKSGEETSQAQTTRLEA